MSCCLLDKAVAFKYLSIKRRTRPSNLKIALEVCIRCLFPIDKLKASEAPRRISLRLERDPPAFCNLMT